MVRLICQIAAQSPIMKIIQESAEHHFLTLLEKLRQEPGGWIGLHFALSRRLEHADAIALPAHIKSKLHKLRQESQTFAENLAARAAAFDRPGTALYRFADGDVILLAAPRTEAERETLQDIFKTMSTQAGPGLSALAHIAKDIYNYQKLADQKFLAARRIESYEAMADTNRVQSIPLRRDRRKEGMVLLVEDDRFTASFAANILNKDYDIVHAKTGEEGIAAYIEHAPDIVLLDIHLPGLDGHETLQAIRKIDIEAAVIMLSVDTVKTNIVSASAGGALGFLKKPFPRDRLHAAILKSPHIKGSKAKS